MKKGDRFRLTSGIEILVKSVAKDESWANIQVTEPNGHTWAKRQVLRDGELPFSAIPVLP